MTTQRVGPLETPPAIATQPQTAWSVVSAGGPIGWVVRFEELGEEGRSFYSVRNLHHQELGLVDTLGRAWKFEPFGEEPNWLGSGSVPEGVSRILSPDSEVVLVKKPITGIESGL